MYILVPKNTFTQSIYFCLRWFFFEEFHQSILLLTSDDEAEHLGHGLADAKGRLGGDGSSAPKTHGTAEQTGQH